MVLDKKMESVVVSVRGTLSIKVSNTQRATINTHIHNVCIYTLVLHSQCTYVYSTSVLSIIYTEVVLSELHFFQWYTQDALTDMSYSMQFVEIAGVHETFVHKVCTLAL